MRYSRKIVFGCLLLLVAAVLVEQSDAGLLFRRRCRVNYAPAHHVSAAPKQQNVAYRPKREHVPNDRLPQDGGMCYLTIFTTPQPEVSEFESGVLNMFRYDAGLIELSAQTHQHHITTADKLWEPRYHDSVGDIMPVVCLTDPRGYPIYLARGDEIPSDPAVLLQQISEGIERYAVTMSVAKLPDPTVRLASLSQRGEQKKAAAVADKPAAVKLPKILPRPKPKPAPASKLEIAEGEGANRSDSTQPAGPQVTLTQYERPTSRSAVNTVDRMVDQSRTAGYASRPTVFPWNKPNPDERPCPDCRPKPDDSQVIPFVPHPHPRLPFVPSTHVPQAIQQAASVSAANVGAVFASVLVLTLLAGFGVWAVTKTLN